MDTTKPSYWKDVMPDKIWREFRKCRDKGGKKIVPLTTHDPKRKIIGLHTDNSRIVPLTVDHSRLVPLTCDDDRIVPLTLD